MSDSRLNARDIAFLSDLVALLHRGVRMSDVASSRSPEPAVRALAHTVTKSESSRIAAIRLCLTKTGAAAPDPTPPSMFPPWMLATADTDDLVHVVTADFDDHYLRQLEAYHHAGIDRARTEMIEGLNSQARDFAEQVIDGNAARLRRIHDLSVA